MNLKLKKEIKEWVILIGVLLLLIYTPIGTTITSTLQRGLLATGLIKPSLQTDESNAKDASYELLLSDFEGNTINLTDYKGKTIFINFWATWCGPCVAEMPDIHDLYTKFRDDEKVEFVMIAVDDNFQKALNFVKEKEYGFPVYQLESGLPSIYQASSIPTTYVISPGGKIVVERHGIAQYNSESFISFIKNLNSSAK